MYHPSLEPPQAIYAIIIGAFGELANIGINSCPKFHVYPERIVIV
jgi:hypothetical protein